MAIFPLIKRYRRALSGLAAAALLAVPLLVPSGAAGSTVTFGKPVQVSANENQSAAEPSIRAARDGTLYISAPTGLGGARIMENGRGGDLLWRSDDDGKTWKFLGNYDPVVGGGDSDIAPDHDGVLWASGLTLANTTAAVSTDKGESFAVNPVGSLSTVVDRQWTETYRAEPFAFMTTGEIVPRSIILSRLERTPGDIPAVVKTVRVSDDDSYQWPGEIAVDERNALVYVGYNTDEEPATKDKIVVTRSDLELEDNKRFEVTTTKGDTFDSFAAIDVDQAGNVYTVWTERRPKGPKGVNGRTNSYVAVSRDKGKSWSAPVKVNADVPTTTFPWIVAGSKGRVAIAYYGTHTRGPSPEDVARADEEAPRWDVYTSYSLDAASKNPRYTNVKTTPDFIHEGNICTSGTGCASGTRDLLDFFQLDLDPCGKIVITYTDNSDDKVQEGGNRVENNAELVSFIGQTGGPRFYSRPLNAKAC